MAAPSARILTLFGDELVPEEMEAVGRKKKGSEIAEIAPDAIVVLAGWEATKKYYTIGEVAELFDLRASGIRYWTAHFDIKVRTTKRGDRMYTTEAIQSLRQIYHLTKERGFTLKGAKAQLKGSSNFPGMSTLDLQQSLLQLRNRLVKLRNALNK